MTSSVLLCTTVVAEPCPALRSRLSRACQAAFSRPGRAAIIPAHERPPMTAARFRSLTAAPAGRTGGVPARGRTARGACSPNSPAATLARATPPSRPRCGPSADAAPAASLARLAGTLFWSLLLAAPATARARGDRRIGRARWRRLAALGHGAARRAAAAPGRRAGRRRRPPRSLRVGAGDLSRAPCSGPCDAAPARPRAACRREQIAARHRTRIQQLPPDRLARLAATARSARCNARARRTPRAPAARRAGARPRLAWRSLAAARLPSPRPSCRTRSRGAPHAARSRVSRVAAGRRRPLDAFDAETALLTHRDFDQLADRRRRGTRWPRPRFLRVVRGAARRFDPPRRCRCRDAAKPSIAASRRDHACAALNWRAALLLLGGAGCRRAAARRCRTRLSHLPATLQRAVAARATPLWHGVGAGAAQALRRRIAAWDALPERAAARSSASAGRRGRRCRRTERSRVAGRGRSRSPHCPSNEQQALRAQFAHSTPPTQHGWLLGPGDRRRLHGLQPLLLQVPPAQRVPLLAAARDDAGRTRRPGSARAARAAAAARRAAARIVVDLGRAIAPRGCRRSWSAVTRAVSQRASRRMRRRARKPASPKRAMPSARRRGACSRR